MIEGEWKGEEIGDLVSLVQWQNCKYGWNEDNLVLMLFNDAHMAPPAISNAGAVENRFSGKKWIQKKVGGEEDGDRKSGA